MSSMATMNLREALPAELEDWDAWTVDVPGGDIYQSSAWAAYRRRWGWRPRFLVFEDGFRLLSLERPWPLVGGSSAYLSRGPITRGEPATVTAARLQAATAFLVAHGVGVIASDPEIEASSGYGDLIRAFGYLPIEEIQPSRHRLSISLAGAREASAMAGFSATARQMVGYGLRDGLTVVRHDRAAATSIEGITRPEGDERAAACAGFERLWSIVAETSDRRGFHLGNRAQFLDWCITGFDAAGIVLLEVVDPSGATVGAGMYYRHGARLTYSHGGDRFAARGVTRGVAQVQTWRAIQIALSEGRAEMDLGGADIRGARRVPEPDDPMFGLYQHKRMYGALWVEMTGNHELVARPRRYALGRALVKAQSLLRR